MARIVIFVFLACAFVTTAVADSSEGDYENGLSDDMDTYWEEEKPESDQSGSSGNLVSEMAGVGYTAHANNEGLVGSGYPDGTHDAYDLLRSLAAMNGYYSKGPRTVRGYGLMRLSGHRESSTGYSGAVGDYSEPRNVYSQAPQVQQPPQAYSPGVVAYPYRGPVLTPVAYSPHQAPIMTPVVYPIFQNTPMLAYPPTVPTSYAPQPQLQPQAQAQTFLVKYSVPPSQDPPIKSEATLLHPVGGYRTRN